MTIHEQIKQSEFVFYSDDEILMVLDYDPISKGHALILPQNPYQDIDELPAVVLLKIFKAAQAYVKLLNKKYSPKGYSMMQNGGTFNDIGVFHLHVFPRNKSEEFGFTNKGKVEEYNLNEFRKILNDEMSRVGK